MNGLITGAVVAAGITLLAGKKERLITYTLIGAASGYALLYYLNKRM